MALSLVIDFNKWNPEVSIKNRIPICAEADGDGVCIVQSDAGVFNDGRIALECVISDGRKIILSACKAKAMTVDASLVEIMAIRWCLSTAHDKNLEEILVQSDSLIAMDCINRIMNRTILESVAVECKNLCNSFSKASVIYVPRTQMSAAHNLFSFGHRHGDCVLKGSYPTINVVVPSLI